MANYFSDRIVEHPGRIKLTPVSGETDTYDVERAEGAVTQTGTPFNAETFNGIAQDLLDNTAEQIAALETTGTTDGWTWTKYSNGRMTAEKVLSTGSTWTTVVSPVAVNQSIITPPSDMDTVMGGKATIQIPSNYVINSQVQISNGRVYLTVHRLSTGTANINFNVTLEGTWS